MFRVVEPGPDEVKRAAPPDAVGSSSITTPGGACNSEIALAESDPPAAANGCLVARGTTNAHQDVLCACGSGLKSSRCCELDAAIDLVGHYPTELALRYLPVRYEDMVADMSGSVRRMLDFIGESFEERCVNFQDNRRLPQTPSYAQVSEKLYDRSRFRYRHYRKHLEPVIPILKPIIERLGYVLD